MGLDHLVSELGDEISFPVPLQACRQEAIEKALESRKRHQAHPIEHRGRHRLKDWRHCLATIGLFSVVAGDESTDALTPMLLREGIGGRYSLKAEEAPKSVRSR